MLRKDVFGKMFSQKVRYIDMKNCANLEKLKSGEFLIFKPQKISR